MGVDLVGVEWLLHLRAGARGRPRTNSAPSADRSGTPSRNQGLAGATEEALQDPNRHMREFVGARAGDWSAKKWRGVVGGAAVLVAWAPAALHRGRRRGKA